MAKKTVRNEYKLPLIFIGIFILGGLFTLLVTQINRSQVRTTNTEAATPGNGAPSGAHYNLNIIGKNGKDCNGQTNDGHRIFVPLQGKTSISLSQGDFGVIDYCGTDGKAAFSLPNPDPTNSGVTTYSVWVRALGKPGGSSKMTTCAYDETGTQYCSVYSSVAVRSTGKSSFTDVSKQLLYVYADLNGDGILERYPLFSDALQGYFWDYDNNGLKVLQMRFYQQSSNVN